MACCFSLGFLIQIHPKNASLLDIFWAPCPPFPPLSLLCPHSPFPLPSLRFLYDDSTGTTRQGCSLVKLPMALNFILLFCDSRILWCWWAVIIRGHMLQPPCGSPTNNHFLLMGRTPVLCWMFGAREIESHCFTLLAGFLFRPWRA